MAPRRGASDLMTTRQRESVVRWEANRAGVEPERVVLVWRLVVDRASGGRFARVGQGRGCVWVGGVLCGVECSPNFKFSCQTRTNFLAVTCADHSRSLLRTHRTAAMSRSGLDLERLSQAASSEHDVHHLSDMMDVTSVAGTNSSRRTKKSSRSSLSSLISNQSKDLVFGLIDNYYHGASGSSTSTADLLGNYGPAQYPQGPPSALGALAVVADASDDRSETALVIGRALEVADADGARLNELLQLLTSACDHARSTVGITREQIQVHASAPHDSPTFIFYSLTSRHSLLPFTAPRVRALRDPRPRRQPPDDQAQFIQRHALLRPGTKARRLSPLAGVRALQSPCRPRAHAYNGWVRAKPARFTDSEPVYSAESVPW